MSQEGQHHGVASVFTKAQPFMVSDKQATPKPASAKASLMEDILADAWAIQDRFVAEPMLKRTGHGILRSRGVEGLRQDAEDLRQRFGRTDSVGPARLSGAMGDDAMHYQEKQVRKAIERVQP